MNRFNRSRREKPKPYKVGTLVEYHLESCGMEPCDLLAIVLEYTQEGYYVIKFLDDGSNLNAVHSAISHVEVS